MRALLGAWRLIRPGNGLMAATGVVAGAVVLTHGRPEWVSVALAAGGAFFGVGGANAVNDYYDAEVDKAAHPDRPIPRGDLSAHAAKGLGSMLLAFGFLLVAMCNVFAAVLALLLVLNLIAYEVEFKAKGILGNFSVSLAVAATFLLGAVVAAHPPLSFPLPQPGGIDFSPSRFRIVLGFAVLAFFANLAREIFKDVQDEAADRGHRTTLPMQVGPRSAMQRGRVFLGIATGAAVIEFFLLSAETGNPFGWFVFADILLIPFVFAMTRRNAGEASGWTKAGMAIALVGFVAIGLI